MLTPEEEVAWTRYVAEMAAKGLEVDLWPLKAALLALEDTPAGQVIGDALGVGTMPLTDLAKRLTLQTKTIVQTGQVPR